MSRDRTMTAALLAVLLLSAAPPALAAPDDADALFRKGSAAVDAGKREQAYDLFLAAWRLKHTHDIAGNLAQVELALGKKRDAAEHIAFALRHFPPSVTAQQDRREKMKQVLDSVRREIGAVRVSVNVPGAEVFVDGALAGRSPLEDDVFVDPGVHTIEARLAGYVTASRRVEAAKGSAIEVELALREAAPPPPPPPGVPVVEKRPIWPAVVTGVLGVGGLAAGVGLTVAANGKGVHALDLGARVGGPSVCHGTAGTSGDCKALHDTLQSKSALSTGAAAGFAIGSALALATAGLGVWVALPAKKADAVQLGPVMSPTQAGILLSGHW